MPAAWAAGTVPSVPRFGQSRAEASVERVISRQQPVGRRDLPTPRDAELLAEHVCVCLRRSGRDAEAVTDLLVRASRGDQRYDLALSLCDFGALPMRTSCMTPR